jgi:hypothetical protein
MTGISISGNGDFIDILRNKMARERTFAATEDQRLGKEKSYGKS